MRLTINGSPAELDSGVTVEEALELLGIRSDIVAVAVNFDCLTRAEHGTRRLVENDEVEILSPQAGG
jgi:thiamine biosynthesis protein ThiS